MFTSLLIVLLTTGIVTGSLVPEKSCSNKKLPKNIILMIGDGMGLAQIYAGMTVNHGHLNMEKFRWIGLSKTYSASDYITDSGAGSTALASGVKTYNKAIGVGVDSVPFKTILEIAEEEGLSTGLVATSSIVCATPAAFIAHQINRYMYDEIATDLIHSGIDLFIGGGRQYFENRSDSMNLTDSLRTMGYQIAYDTSELKSLETGKVAALLMVEGSLIDKACHENDTNDIILEVLDFNKAVGKALEFAIKDKNTLLIVTADHETGGIALTGGNFGKGTVEMSFAGHDHTGIPVPVFAYGPGAENFAGFYENTEIFHKMMQCFGFSY
jgi:alkaline phosphatase